jgi:hypothetical protein
VSSSSKPKIFSGAEGALAKKGSFSKWLAGSHPVFLLSSVSGRYYLHCYSSVAYSSLLSSYSKGKTKANIVKVVKHFLDTLYIFISHRYFSSSRKGGREKIPKTILNTHKLFSLYSTHNRLCLPLSHTHIII